ncbi:MAG: tyrosine-type recombinase/integrase [Sediminibacterium sp.]
MTTSSIFINNHNPGLVSLERGYYMNSVIAADARAKCAQCGQQDWKTKEISKKRKGKSFTLSINYCQHCGGEPDQIRIRRYLPTGINGEAKRIEIRFDEGERIRDIDHAKDIAAQIDNEIIEGRFDANKYRPKSELDEFKFFNFVEKRYLPTQLKKLARGELSPASLRNKKTSIKHLNSYFAEIDIRYITSGKIIEFYENFESPNCKEGQTGERTRVLITQELKVILNYALMIEAIPKLPTFPKAKKAGFRDVERFLSEEDQALVISNVENPIYKIMIEILAFYALRPSDVRALKWCDLDFKAGVIIVRRHLSANTVLDGRKSSKKFHLLPMNKKFLEIIAPLPIPINQDEYIFHNNGKPLGDKVLSRAWKKACIKSKIQEVDLYSGTKHSRLSSLKRQGFSDAELMALTGHESEAQLSRYAQVNANSKLKLVKDMVG